MSLFKQKSNYDIARLLQENADMLENYYSDHPRYPIDKIKIFVEAFKSRIKESQPSDGASYMTRFIDQQLRPETQQKLGLVALKMGSDKEQVKVLRVDFIIQQALQNLARTYSGLSFAIQSLALLNRYLLCLQCGDTMSKNQNECNTL